MAPRRARAIQWLSNTVLRATTESRSSTIGHINLDRKQAGKPSARNGHARFDAAGAENQLTIRLVRHSQRKRGATDRSNLRSLASVLDPTFGESNGNVGIIRSPLRAIALSDQLSEFQANRAVSPAPNTYPVNLGVETGFIARSLGQEPAVRENC